MKLATPWLTLLSLLAAGLALAGAPPSTATPASTEDPTASAVRAAWQEVEAYWERVERDDATKADDPQRRLGGEMFRLYLDHPETKSGAYALESAFAMWTNAGALPEIEQALDRVDVRSAVWSRFLSTIGGAYSASGRDRDYLALCLRLEDRLTHPAARSEVLLEIGDRFAAEGKVRRARRRYREVVRLGYQPFYVHRAEGSLHELASLRVGCPAPDFLAVDLDGNRFHLTEAKGTVVLLDFWATTCAPCIAEIPILRDTQAKNDKEAFRLIGISLDTEAPVLKSFLDREKLPWPQIRVENEWESEIARLYNVRWIPRTYLIDPDGRIAAKDLRGRELEEAVAKLLGTRSWIRRNVAGWVSNRP